jgi:hypothetical protein
MKTKFCIICFLFAFVTCNTIAQMPNGNFNFTCANPGSSGIFYDAFRYNTPGTGNCGLDPWAVSHGTPDIEKFNSAQVPFTYYAAVSGGANFGQTSIWGSEGIFQNYNFYKGNRYFLRAFVRGYHVNDGENFDVDRVFIALTNGLVSKNILPSGQNANYSFPQNERQDIWFEDNFKSPWKLIEKEFIANADFSQLWISLIDDNGDTYLQQEAYFAIGGIYISCCPYDKTITEFTNFNGPLPNYVQSSVTAGNKISTTGLVIIPPWSQNVNLLAGKEVVLGAGFAAQNGSFSATVIPNSCNCSIGGGNVEDICNVFPGNVTYIPNANGPGVYVPNYFNRDVSTNWYPSSFGYAKPYNAFFWRLTIVNRWGAEVYRAENTAGVDGFVDKSITWNGGSVSTGVYFVKLDLTNCTGTFTYNGSLTVDGSPRPSALNTNSKTTPFDFARVETSFEVEKIPEKTTLVSIYPNPASELVTLKYQIASAGNVKIVLFDEMGNRKKAIILEEKHPTGNFEFDYSVESLAPGIYFCRFETNDTSETKKVVIVR